MRWQLTSWCQLFARLTVSYENLRNTSRIVLPVRAVFFRGGPITLTHTHTHSHNQAEINLCVPVKSIILPVVLYECETWSLVLREERRLKVFENRVLRRIFGPKRDGVTGEWRNLHNEELNDLRRMRWVGHVAPMGERRGVYRVLVGKPEGKRPLGRHRRLW